MKFFTYLSGKEFSFGRKIFEMKLVEDSEENVIRLSILIESSKAALNDLERITSLLLETLSGIESMTLEINKIDYRISKTPEGTTNSISYKLLL